LGGGNRGDGTKAPCPVPVDFEEWRKRNGRRKTKKKKGIYRRITCSRVNGRRKKHPDSRFGKSKNSVNPGVLRERRETSEDRGGRGGAKKGQDPC